MSPRNDRIQSGYAATTPTPTPRPAPRPSRPKAPNKNAGLEEFLSSIRLLESGSYEGNYGFIGRRENGVQPRGAYGILDSNWKAWASRAGLSGADWRDIQAQDRVAAHRAQDLQNTYGTWDMAAAAWIGGTESARKILQRGFGGIEDIQNAAIREYVENFQKASKVAPSFGVAQRAMPTQAKLASASQSQAAWVNPVAGPNEYSRGSWMPGSLTHRGRTHAATDVYAERGTPIVAPVNGTVISTKKSKIGGNTARVRGDDGIIYYFAHMEDAAVVGAGQRLLKGNHIGYVGNSGSAKNTKPHLHFSMKKANGDAINPYSFLSGSGEVQTAPTAMAYGSGPNRQESVSGKMNTMLDDLSNKIAGGQRDPSILVGEQVGQEFTGGEDVPTTGGVKDEVVV